jgi:hypothetical protein
MLHICPYITSSSSYITSISKTISYNYKMLAKPVYRPVLSSSPFTSFTYMFITMRRLPYFKLTNYFSNIS